MPNRSSLPKHEFEPLPDFYKNLGATFDHPYTGERFNALTLHPYGWSVGCTMSCGPCSRPDFCTCPSPTRDKPTMVINENCCAHAIEKIQKRFEKQISTQEWLRKILKNDELMATMELSLTQRENMLNRARATINVKAYQDQLLPLYMAQILLVFNKK